MPIKCLEEDERNIGGLKKSAMSDGQCLGIWL